MPRRSSNPQRFLPLNPPFYHILLALGNQHLHGYAIRKELERRTDGEITILPGTLYSSIGRMVDDGLIRETSAAPADRKRDPRRRYYGVTELGKQVAAAESQRLAVLLDLAKAQHMTGRARASISGAR